MSYSGCSCIQNSLMKFFPYAGKICYPLIGVEFTILAEENLSEVLNVKTARSRFTCYKKSKKVNTAIHLTVQEHLNVFFYDFFCNIYLLFCLYNLK